MGRQLLKTYNFIAGSREITVIQEESFTSDDIRLIVNETQKVVITSSMMKDNIVSVVNNVITYKSTLPVLNEGDRLTIEVDLGVGIVYLTNAEIAEGKENIATALTTMGQQTSATESLNSMASKIYNVGLDIQVAPSSNYPLNWHDLLVEMMNNYDPTKPYMYALLLEKYTPQNLVDLLTDGETQIISNKSNDYSTIYVIFKSSNQNGFGFSYGTTFNPYIYGAYVYNANIQNVSFDGTLINFLYFNSDYSYANLTFSNYQFRNTNIVNLNIPNTTTIDAINVFETCSCRFVNFIGTSPITINGTQMFKGCSSLESVCFKEGITSIIITAPTFFQSNTSLRTFKLPNTLEILRLNSSYMFWNQQNIKHFIVPDSIRYLALDGSYLFSNTLFTYMYFGNPTEYFSNQFNMGLVTTLETIELGMGWKWTFNISRSLATGLSHDCIVNLIFGKLVDKRYDGINPTTCSTISGSPIVTFTNGNCTKAFVSNAYIQHTINISGTNYTILSVNNDNQVTLNVNVTSTFSDIPYNMNRTLTLGATNLARVSAAEIQVATDKGWTIA